MHHLDEGTGTEGADLKAIMDRVQIALSLRRRAGDPDAEEAWPGLSGQAREHLRDWLRGQA